MKRQIIQIDKEKCSGCGLCVSACHEGAIGLEDGKAKLLRDDYCDGLGNCLPVCPTGAITFEEREAAAFDEAAVQQKKTAAEPLPCGCPGSQSKELRHAAAPVCATPIGVQASQLRQWPVQIQLAPVNAPYFKGAHLLVAADCTAYALADFHGRFMKNKITLIGCPKLDEPDYADKLGDILTANDIRSISVVRMEVPCCGGIVRAVEEAIRASGKIIPWSITTVSTEGDIIED